MKTSKGIIRLPAEVSDLVPVISASGGKDSTATLLAAREADIPFRAVFADTGWEAPETYEHLDDLRRRIGPIDVVRAKRNMVEEARHRAGFPMRGGRWCTEKLKIEPLRAYHDAIEKAEGRETINIVGVRAEESAARAALKVLEDDDEWGGYVWRPILDWTVADVIEIHKRHGVPMNPLYHAGFDRVGCMPCIFARKEEVRLMADRYPGHVAEIERLEAELTELRAVRNAEEPGRYKHPVATFFSGRDATGARGIRDVIAWSRTEKGGKQIPILQPPPSGGCMRWGLCEAPPAPATEVVE